MKHPVFFLAALLCISPLKSQVYTNKSLASMIQLERDFSRSAKEYSTRQAFLSFTNEESLGFNNGPVSLKKEWEQRKADSSWLWWEPDYADIAASGEFGFTSGPWEYRTNRKDENAVAHGHFFTIWRKDASGIWKVLIDMGISYKEPIKRTPISTAALHAASPQISTKEELLAFDTGLYGNQLIDFQHMVLGALSPEARFYQTNFPPFIGKKSISEHLSKREPIAYSSLGCFIAQTGDLGVVYGTATFRASDPASSKKANFLHVWKKEDGSTWKLVVEVVE
jgi:ketosteroid isomerase-like protein